MTQRLLKYGGALFLLALLLVGAFGFPDVLNAYVVQPVAISLWAIWRIIASVHQAVYWILLIVLCVLLMLRVFSVHDAGVAVPAQHQTPRQPARVEYWRGLLKQAGRSRDGDAALRSSLRNLLAASLRQADRPFEPDLSRAVAARNISLPAGLREFLSLDNVGNAQPARSATLAGHIRRWLRRPATRNDILIEEFLRWMETAMEISHDQ